MAGQPGVKLTDPASGVLSENGPVTAGRLAELTGLLAGATTGIVDRAADECVPR